jgi:hypothetical protein
MPIRNPQASPSARVEYRVPRFLHLLTAVHACGAVACAVLAIGSGVSTDVRNALAISGGSTIMVEAFGAQTWAFLASIGAVLGTLAYASWHLLPWAWPLTLAVYGVGVLGSLWQVSVGIPQGWISATINAGVLIYASTSAVRRAYARG